MTRRVLYVAHCLRPTEEEIEEARGGQFAKHEPKAFYAAAAIIRNARRALDWRNWLRATFDDVTFIAPWIGDVLAGDDDSDPAQRERGMRDNCALITKLDGIVLCGPRISPGMDAERAAFVMGEAREVARSADQDRRRTFVYDLTVLGSTPPTAEFKQPSNFDEWARNISMLSELAK